jgi:hypothetical protein
LHGSSFITFLPTPFPPPLAILPEVQNRKEFRHRSANRCPYVPAHVHMPNGQAPDSGAFHRVTAGLM